MFASLPIPRAGSGTGSGRIASGLPLEASRRSRGYLAGTIGDGSGRIALETGSGNISLRRGR